MIVAIAIILVLIAGQALIVFAGPVAVFVGAAVLFAAGLALSLVEQRRERRGGVWTTDMEPPPTE